jgi:hypothetical protein
VRDITVSVNEEEMWKCGLMKTTVSAINLMVHFIQVVILVTKRHISHQQVRDKSDTSLHTTHASTKAMNAVNHSIQSFGFDMSYLHLHIHDINIT